jgi:hypothetical protein
VCAGSRTAPWAVRDDMVLYDGHLYIPPTSPLLQEIVAAIHDDGMKACSAPGTGCSVTSTSPTCTASSRTSCGTAPLANYSSPSIYGRRVSCYPYQCRPWSGLT